MALAAVDEGECGVLSGAQAGEQMELLEYETHHTVPEQCAFGVRQVGDVHSQQAKRSAIWSVEQCENVQQCRLARA